MGPRDTARQSFPTASVALALLAVVALSVGSPSVAAAQTPPSPPPETLLPPADEDSIDIVPTDEHPVDPTPTPATGPEDTGSGGPDDPVTTALLVLAALGITALAMARLARMVFVWRSPITLGAAGFGPAVTAPCTSFSLLVPAREAGGLLARTLDHLAALDHPSVEIVAVVPYDDYTARAAVLTAAMRHPERVHLFADWSYRRPRAAGLNAALAECGGEVIGIVEPGDTVHPRLLRHVDAAFADETVAAVQGGIQLVARGPRWFSARTIVERYFWSRSRLQQHATQRFTPLEGSTAFVRTSVLRDLGGWNEDCDAEGCDLGVRLSVRGERIVVAYDPEMATRKRAPSSTARLLADRIAWMTGFVQVLGQGAWRRLPTRGQRLRARVVLARPFMEGLASLAILGAGLGVVLASPGPTVTALLLLPVIPALATIGVEMVGLAELIRINDGKLRRRDQLWLVASAFPFMLLMAGATIGVVVGRLRPRHGESAMPVAQARRLPGHERLGPLAGTDPTVPPYLDLTDRRTKPAASRPTASHAAASQPTPFQSAASRPTASPSTASQPAAAQPAAPQPTPFQSAASQTTTPPQTAPSETSPPPAETRKAPTIPTGWS